MTNLLIHKLYLLGEWQYLCHDDFDPDEDMNEDEFWDHLQTLTPEKIQEMVDEDHDDSDLTLQDRMSLYLGYMSHKYQDMIPNEQTRKETA